MSNSHVGQADVPRPANTGNHARRINVNTLLMSLTTRGLAPRFWWVDQWRLPRIGMRRIISHRLHNFDLHQPVDIKRLNESSPCRHLMLEAATQIGQALLDQGILTVRAGPSTNSLTEIPDLELTVEFDFDELKRRFVTNYENGMPGEQATTITTTG